MPTGPEQLTAAFVEAAVSDSSRAEDLLRSHPEIANAGLYAALVLGNADAVEESLRTTPEVVKGKGGPLGWEPLIYVCFSRFADPRDTRAAELVRTAEILLRHGADPNASWISKQYPDSPLPCLYGATGVNNNPALALVLLQAGANPNDSESLYHSTEHCDLVCFRMLLEHGASPKSTNVLKHLLDGEQVEGLKLLLESEADPNEVNQRGETALHWAVWRGRSARVISMLLEHGADIDAQRADGRTAYALARQSGQDDIAEMLASRGANTFLSPMDRFLAAAHDGSPAEFPENTPHAARFLPDLAARHAISAVRALLLAGVPVDARGEHGGTALHWACWKGYADVVALLLRHGASLTIEDDQFHATPPGWFAHGLQNCGDGDGDYAATLRMLIAAGARIPPADIPTGKPEIDAILREHGLLGPPRA